MEWTRAIEPEILHAFNVDPNPVVCVLISVNLSSVRAIGIIFAQPDQFGLIDCTENAPRTYRMYPTATVLPQTFRRVTSKEFLELLRKPHNKEGCNEAGGTQGMRQQEQLCGHW